MRNLLYLAVLVAAVAATLGITKDAHAADSNTVLVTVLPDQFIVGDRAIDDLTTLESQIRSTGAKAIVLNACGAATARPQLAAAQRLSNLYLELMVSQSDSPACVSAFRPRSVPISRRIGLRPFGIDDEAVNRWLISVMP